MINRSRPNFERLYEVLRAEHGEFDFFAALRPEVARRRRWDLILSAPWLENTLEGYEMLVQGMHRALTPDEEWRISRTPIVPASYPPLAGFLAAHPEFTGEPFVAYDFEFAGVPIRRGVFLKVNRAAILGPSAAVPA